MIRVSYEMDTDGRSFSVCVERDDPEDRMFGHGAIAKDCPPEYRVREAVRTMTDLMNGCLSEMKL